MTFSSLPLSLRLKALGAAAVLGAGALVAPLAAHAQGAPSFAEVDSNVDGVISEDEFLAAMPSMTADQFAEADTNGDTVLTEDEYDAMTAAME